MHLITTNQTKMLKSERYKYLSGILNLAPALKLPDGSNTCPNAGQCKAYCLQNTGRNRFPLAHAARYRRTMLYFEDRKLFTRLLMADIASLEGKAKAMGFKASIRLNGLSDIDFENTCPDVFSEFPKVQFIDYTKRPERLFVTQPKNYHLTYSVNEKTPPGLLRRLYTETEFNAAMVFSPEKPSMYEVPGWYPKGWDDPSPCLPVFDGDNSDLRHLDPRGQIVGLRFKLPFINGKSVKSPKRGFVILQ